MQVTVLGSGTAIPVPGRFPAGYLVEIPDTVAMVDCGPGTLRRLAMSGVGLDRLDALLLTHYHTDHCADVAALLFALRSPHFAGRRPLRVFGAATQIPTGDFALYPTEGLIRLDGRIGALPQQPGRCCVRGHELIRTRLSFLAGPGT